MCLQPQLVQFFPKLGAVTLIDVSESYVLVEKGNSGHLRIQGKEEIGVISNEFNRLTYCIHLRLETMLR